MVAEQMVQRGVSRRRVAAQLDVDESTLRYHSRRGTGAPDGRRDRPSILNGWDDRVDAVLMRFDDGRVVGDGRGRCGAQQLHAVLVGEYGFTGSYQAVRRYLARRFPQPVQAFRRVETPAGVQAQHDWFDFTGRIGGEEVELHGLTGTLSHSRARFAWVSPTMTQLAWQTGHLALFERYGGVPLWVRHDNLRTAVSSGGGPSAVLNPVFERFARSCGFGIDPCRVRKGSDKGKVERGVRSERGDFADLLLRDWATLEALQTALDERSRELQVRRVCPITGTTVAEALAAERLLLLPIPAMHEPFDCVVARPVSRDCLISFEGRRYSVPFRWVGRSVEVRGTAHHVVVLAEGSEIARHPRHTASRLVLRQSHFEGESTSAVLAPTPLGRRALLQLEGRGAWNHQAPAARPLREYVELVDRLGELGQLGQLGQLGELASRQSDVRVSR